MKVILFGASGMVGQGVLRECLHDPSVTQVLSIGLFAVWFVIVKLVFVPIASHEVDSFMPSA